MSLQMRKLALQTEEIHIEGGRPADPPLPHTTRALTARLLRAADGRPGQTICRIDCLPCADGSTSIRRSPGRWAWKLWKG